MASHISGISQFNAVRTLVRSTAGAVLLSGFVLWTCGGAFALSEIQEQEKPEASDLIERQPLPPSGGVPSDNAGDETLPDEDQSATPAAPLDENMEPGDGERQGKQAGRVEIDPNGPIPVPVYDIEKLPEPVKRMRNLIIEAAKSGNIEALRPLIGNKQDGTLLALGDIEGDPIEFLKDAYSESDGQELLAILEEVLSAPYVHLDAGTPEEIYIWPYFAAVPLERLDPRQRVELFKILTAYDYEEMKAAGAYTFYRAGISPEGNWEFFVAGD